MAGNRNHTIGMRGEQLAAEYLERLGYDILARRYRRRTGELDLICSGFSTGDAGAREIVFVEVKTRTSSRYGRPEEAVTPAKQARLQRLAQEYLVAHGLEDSNVRFDVLAIEIGPAEEKLDHITNAF